MRNKILWILALVGALAPAAWAQQATANWDNLKQIKDGQRIQVVERNLRSTTGKLLRLSDSEIVLQVGKDEVTIPREKVYRVSEDHQRGRKALAAGVGGACIGALVGAFASREVSGSGSKAIVVVAETGAFGAIFAGVSALATRNPTVYRAEQALPPAAPRSPAR